MDSSAAHRKKFCMLATTSSYHNGVGQTQKNSSAEQLPKSQVVGKTCNMCNVTAVVFNSTSKTSDPSSGRESG
jgi:hypothetical protein